MAARSLYLIVVLGALSAVSAWALAAEPASRAANAAPGEIGLSDDDVEAPLFQLTDLAPGQAQSRCITVTNDGGAPNGIRLIGSAAGSLPDLLRFTVDAGSGGRFGDCSGFAGTPVFDGSLAGFVGAHHDYASGLVALTPEQSGSTTFRLRVALDDVAAAQGATATASFTWEARNAEISVQPPPPPATTDPPGEADSSPPKPGPTPDPDKDPPRDTPNDERPAPAPSTPPVAGGGTPVPPLLENGARARSRAEASRTPKRPRRSTSSKTKRDQPPVARRPPRATDSDDGFLAALSKLVVPIVKRTAFPLLLLIIAGLFLLLQNRLDRRDPKLALAPLHAQPDLPFLPPLSPGEART